MQENESNENQDENNQKKEKPAPIVFEATELSPGDKVGTMEVVKVEKVAQDKELSNNNVSVTFTGEVTVTGTHVHRTGLIEGECMEDLDNGSEQKLPRTKTDERSIWFCFSNEDEARGKLQQKERENVTVLMRTYTYKSYPSTVKNAARFLELTEAE